MPRPQQVKLRLKWLDSRHLCSDWASPTMLDDALRPRAAKGILEHKRAIIFPATRRDLPTELAPGHLSIGGQSRRNSFAVVLLP